MKIRAYGLQINSLIRSIFFLHCKAIQFSSAACFFSSFLCAVLQTVQTVRDGDLPEEGTPALHRLREGERSAVHAVLSHSGNTRQRERERERERKRERMIPPVRQVTADVSVQTHTC